MASIKRFHPGVYLQDALDAMEMRANEFSLRTGISERVLSSLINGKSNMSFDIAHKLADYFDTSIDFWTSLQNQYDLYLMESEEKKAIKEDWEIIKPFKKFLLKNKYIDETMDSETIVKNIRLTIGVNSLCELNKKSILASFKRQKSVDENVFAQNFWILLALKKAREHDVHNYDKKQLVARLPSIKKLILTKPNHFYPKLLEIFNECGVSFVFLPYLTKSNIYGVTKWLNSNDVMIAVSNRNQRADLFWFTLFHEISHLLMEHKREILCSIEGIDDKNADKMAKNLLIDQNNWNRFLAKNKFGLNEIKNFAYENDVLPCIVLGRLEKEKKIDYGKYEKYFNVIYDF